MIKLDYSRKPSINFRDTDTNTTITIVSSGLVGRYHFVELNDELKPTHKFFNIKELEKLLKKRFGAKSEIYEDFKTLQQHSMYMSAVRKTQKLDGGDVDSNDKPAQSLAELKKRLGK